MSVRSAVTRWDQDPIIKLVGLILTTSIPVVVSAVALTWQLSREAESIRNKLDQVAKEHEKFEARVRDVEREHHELRVNVAKCCKVAAVPQVSPALWSINAVYR